MSGGAQARFPTAESKGLINGVQDGLSVGLNYINIHMNANMDTNINTNPPAACGHTAVKWKGSSHQSSSHQVLKSSGHQYLQSSSLQVLNPHILKSSSL